MGRFTASVGSEAAVRLARELAYLAEEVEPDLARGVHDEVARLEAAEFQLAAFGEFKRGKSTLLNALLHVPVLPMGVVPVTAVVTEVRAGPPGVVVHHDDGTTEDVGLDDVMTFVTEAGNPDNVRRVARVEVHVTAPLLDRGVVLIDTPGFGSVHAHDASASWQLGRSDGAIVVLSADAPFSQRDAQVVRDADATSGRLFVVVNRVDHLGSADRDAVRVYITDQVGTVLGRRERVWLVSARAALEGVVEQSFEWSEFEATLSGFVETDLAAAQRIACCRRLGAVVVALETRVAVEEDAQRRSVAELDALVAALAEIGEQDRQRFDDETTLLRRDAARLVDDVAAKLQQRTRAAVAPAISNLRALLAPLPTQALVSGADEGVEAAVREAFDVIHREVTEEAAERFDAMVQRFTERLRQQNDATHERVVATLGLALPAWPPVHLAEEPERFTYLFLHVGTTTEYYGALGRRLLPDRVRRRRSLAKAERAVADELDKHAGRARADFAARLDVAIDRLVASARAQVSAHVESVHRALAAVRDQHERDATMRDARVAELGVAGARLAALQTELAALERTEP